MITLEQIQLLEQKVETAVAKIAALQDQNERLSAKCTQLEKTNSELTARYSSIEADQDRIEQGILHALNRLNSMENTVLAAGSMHEQVKNDVHTEESAAIETTETSAAETTPPALNANDADPAENSAPVPAEALAENQADSFNLDFETEPAEPAENSEPEQFNIF